MFWPVATQSWKISVCCRCIFMCFLMNFHRNFMSYSFYLVAFLEFSDESAFLTFLRNDIKMIFLGNHSFPCQEDSWFTSNLTLIIYFSYTSHAIWMPSISYFLDMLHAEAKIHDHLKVAVVVFSSFLNQCFSYHISLPTLYYMLGWTRIYVFYGWPNVFMIICKGTNIFTLTMYTCQMDAVSK